MTGQMQRKYQPLWEQLKEYTALTIQLQPTTITKEQARQQFNTIRRAISKEKYQDIHYREANPTAKLEFILDTDLRQVTFKLEHSTEFDIGNF